MKPGYYIAHKDGTFTPVSEKWFKSIPIVAGIGAAIGAIIITYIWVRFPGLRPGELIRTILRAIINYAKS